MSNRTQLASWQALEQSAAKMKQTHLKTLFAQDGTRFSKFSTQIPGVLFDYSKQLIDNDVFANLVSLAKECDIASWRDKMFSGEKINITEERSVLHTALRNRAHTPLIVDGENVTQAVDNELAKIKVFVEKVRSGQWLGYTGKAVKDVVSIGVGGSNLGPQMATEALKALADNTLNVHYVSNADGVQIASVLQDIDPETTLFVISSKTFTTSETMTNAKTAVDWFLETTKDESTIAKHFVAVSTNLEKTAAFGIADENVFTMWDWVGGRFSLWSAVGLSICCAVGYHHFEDLLKGAHEMDQHFKTAPFSENIPVSLGLISVWYTNFFKCETEAVIPYSEALHKLVPYLQQAIMESNGKSVDRNGNSVAYQTGNIVWGATGTNAQHAFFQLLHQGTKIIPAEFICFKDAIYDVGEHQNMLLANCLAQTEALMEGKRNQQEPYRDFSGNKPTTTILINKLTPKSLGSLLAMYEHKLFVQGVVWNIFSYDQWGVELGKQLANNTLQAIRANDASLLKNASTQAIFKKL